MRDVVSDPGHERDLLVAEVGLSLAANEGDAAPARVAGAEHGAQLGAESKRSMKLAVSGAAIGLAVSLTVQCRDGRATAEEIAELGVVGLEQFPPDRKTGLGLPAAVHAVARRALGAEGPQPAGPSSARVRLTSGQWLTVQAASLRGDDPGPEAVAVTLALTQ